MFRIVEMLTIECLEIMDVSARNGKIELPMIVEALEMTVGD
jgi:hypothetical protein